MPSLHPLHQDILRQAIRERYQREHPDPKDVSATQIARYFATRPGTRLGQATVHRFFSDYAPRDLNTLNVLADYAGHQDITVFQRYCYECDNWSLRSHRDEALPQAYELMLRLRATTGSARAVGSQAAAVLVQQPAGRDHWMQAWVDLAYLTDYYGELLPAYRAGRVGPEGEIFAAGLLYLRALLTNERAERERRATELAGIEPRPSLPAFALGRWEFARLMEQPNRPLPAAELAVLRAKAQQAVVPPAGTTRPAAYNYFPLGYRFLVAEALFLRREWVTLAEWAAEAEAALHGLLFEQAGNVFGEVLRAWRVAAHYQAGETLAPKVSWLEPAFHSENRWLWDYYEVYLWLAQLLAGASATKASALRSQVAAFAAQREMPYFNDYLRKISDTTA